MENSSSTETKKKNKIFPIILAIIVISGSILGVSKYIHNQHHEETDDAQIDGNISPTITRISGYIQEVKVKDFQKVKKGDTLLVIDNRELMLKLHQAEASLAAVMSGLEAAKATAQSSSDNAASISSNISSIDVQIEIAKINLWRAQQDFERYKNLIKDHTITEQQFEQASATKQSAERQLSLLQEQKQSVKQQSKASISQSKASGSQVNVALATIKQKQAEVEQASLNLSYTIIRASEDGQISKVTVQLGQYVNSGQALFNLVLDKSLWATANFKETQLTKMKVGQKVNIQVDAFPDQEIKGIVSAFSPATGAKFSLLPPDNASGNFVKVVQRIPVKIDLKDNDSSILNKLRPGMNIEVDVLID